MTMLPDERERARASTSLDETLLVEASAGTGKTTTMVRRLSALLTTPTESGGDPPSLREVVAITFTERAAQELKDRLRAELFVALRRADDRTRRFLTSGLAELEQAPLGTIHSFCSRILRQYPVEAGIDVQFSVADGRAAEDLQATVWEEWLMRELSRQDGPEVLHRALEMELSLPTLRRLGRELLDHRAWPVTSLLADQDATIDWEAAFAKLDRWVALVRSGNPETGRKLHPSQLALVEKMSGWLDALRDMNDEQRQAALVGPLPFVANKNAISPVVAGFYGTVAWLRAAMTHRFVLDIVRWLDRPPGTAGGPGFLREYARAKEAQGLLDFDDLLIRARDLVRSNAGVRKELQRQYRHIIVDEFQDTDPVQSELIVTLAQEPSGDEQPWTRAALTPGKLCVVGDPKQSIYRFRGADIEAYSQVAGLIGKGRTCHLRTNFRSHVEIIVAVNSIFSQPGVFHPPDAPTTSPLFQPDYQPLEPNPNAPGGEPPGRVRRLVPASGAFEAKLETGRPLEARLVAAAIREIVSTGWPVTDPDTKEVRPARWGDVAVLYRSSNVLAPFEREFRRQAVPYRVIGGKGFFEREEVVRLIAVLTAIEQPGDALNVVAALRSPFFGVSDADLAAGALAVRSRFDYRDGFPDGLPESIRDAFLCLRELHRRRWVISPATVVQELYERTKILSVYAHLGDGEQAVANLLKVIDEARRLERDGPVPFRRLTQHLHSLSQGGGEEGEATLGDEGGARVNLLTVHRAKGLEFPIVVVIDLGASMDGGRGDRGPRLISIRSDPDGAPAFALNLNVMQGQAPLCTVRWHDLAGSDDEREHAEAIRLLYVALTRARDYLILPKVIDRRTRDAGTGPRSWQEIIEAAPAWGTWCDWSPRSDGEPSARPPVIRPPAPPPDEDALSAMRSELVRSRLEATARGARMRVRVRRPSLHEIERGTTDEDAPPIGVEDVSSERDRARRLGTVVHAALERLNPGDEDRVGECIDLLAGEHQLTEAERARAIGQTGLGLRAGVVRRAMRARRWWKEVPVVLCEPSDEVTCLTRGVCDLVFEQDGGLVLVDYKTDRGAPGDVPALVARYRDQLREYVRALEAGAGRPVVEAWLCFLGFGDTAVEERVDASVAR